MPENKTKATDIAIDDFIAAVPDATRQADATVLRAMMERITGEPATMWGPTIIGFGAYDYAYDSGHKGTACRMGFSPRKAEQVLYVLVDRPGMDADLAALGKHRRGKSCLYVKRLADVDADVLERIARECWAEMNRRYPA
jgi:hypothetical protein